MTQIFLQLLLNLCAKSREEGQSRRLVTQCLATCGGGGCCVSPRSLVATNSASTSFDTLIRVSSVSLTHFDTLFFLFLRTWNCISICLLHLKLNQNNLLLPFIFHKTSFSSQIENDNIRWITKVKHAGAILKTIELLYIGGKDNIKSMSYIVFLTK